MTRLDVAAVLCVLVVLPSLASVDSQSYVQLSGDRAAAGEGRLKVLWRCDHPRCPFWLPVCDDGFDNNTAQVACYELGFGRNGFATRCTPTAFGKCTQNVRCQGSETSFAACIPDNCTRVFPPPSQGYAVCLTCIAPPANLIITINVDDEILELYVDGVLIPNELLPRRQLWWRADSVTVSPNFELVAVSALDGGGEYGLIASFRDNNFVTDFSWKCIDATVTPSGWMNVEFDDSTWPQASDAKQNTTIARINPAVKWIWTAGYNRQVVCRGRRGALTFDDTLKILEDEENYVVVNPANIWPSGSSLAIDADNEVLELYIDGVLISNELLPHRLDWTVADVVHVVPNFEVVAILASDYGGGYGLISFLSDNSFVTDVSWKCIDATNKTADWMSVQFDDKAWPQASISHAPDTIDGISRDAKWIWTAEYHKQVACRGRHETTTTEAPTTTTTTTTPTTTTLPPVLNPATVWSSTNCGRSKYADAGRIQDTYALVVGGQAAREHEYPWQVSVRQKYYTSTPSQQQLHYCGGSIINQRWILTAAHCIENEYGQRLRKSAIVVVVGNHQHSAPSSAQQTFNVATIVLRSRIFTWRTFNKDIALFKLSRDIVFSENVQPVCPPNQTEHYTGWKAYVSGWGQLNYTNFEYPDTLQHTSMDITSNERCQSHWRRANEPHNIGASMVCAYGGADRRVDVCKGDSGGPLTVKDDAGRFHLVGIVSFGNLCSTDTPSVYTRVSSHIDWISRTISD